MPFTTRIIVAFGDVDSAGLVYYPNLFHYCHVAMERFFDVVCEVSYSELLSTHRLGFPTVRIESEFLLPIVYGDEIEVQVGVLAVGRSSVTFEYTLKRTSDLTLCVRATAVQVCMDVDQRHSVSLPSNIRKALASIVS